MNLRIGIEITNALNINNHKLMIRTLECEMRKGLRSESNVLGVVHKAGVRVVLGVVAFDKVLEVIERRVRPLYKLKYGHLKHIDFLRRIVLIVDLRPQFRVHL